VGIHTDCDLLLVGGFGSKDMSDLQPEPPVSRTRVMVVVVVVVVGGVWEGYREVWID
jgi:hypothetical protein